jgi:hypothetical protein
VSAYAHLVGLDTTAETCNSSDPRLRDLYAYHGPFVYGIESAATPVDTAGTLLLFNEPSLLLTSCHFNVLSFAELRDHENVIFFHPENNSFTIHAPAGAILRFILDGNHYVCYMCLVISSSGIIMKSNAIPHDLRLGDHPSGNQTATLFTRTGNLSPSRYSIEAPRSATSDVSS